MKLYVFSGRRLLICLLILTSSLLLVFGSALRDQGALTVFSQQRQIPVYSVDVPDKKVSITFDCAWGAEDIPDILNTLKKADIRATFFLVGTWAEKNPDTVRLIAQDGHDIANHSYAHFRMGSLGREKISSEIAQCGDLLEKLTGKKCDLFRAPYGDYNNVVLEEARRLGYFTIQWDVDSLDWKPGIGRDEIMQRVRSKTRPGSIILFHNDTPYTAKLLPSVISELQSENFVFVPVSELILRENYYIDSDGRQKSGT